MKKNKLLIQNTFSNIVFRLISVVISFLSFGYIVKYLGRELFGLYSFLFAIVLFMRVFRLGSVFSIMKYTSEFYSRNDKYHMQCLVTNSLFLTLLSNGLISICLIVVSVIRPGIIFQNINPELHVLASTLLIIFAIFNLINGIFEVSSGILSGLQKYHLLNKIRIVTTLGLIVVIVFIKLDIFDLISFVIIINGCEVLSGLITYKYVKSILPYLKFNCIPVFKELKSIFSFNLFEVLNLASHHLFISATKWIVQIKLGVMSVAAYEIARKPKTFLEGFVTLPLSAMLPACSEASSKGDRAYLNNLLLSGTRWYLLLLCPMIFTLALLMKDFLSVWLGNEYLDLVFYAKIFIFPWLVALPFAVAGNIILGGGRCLELGVINFISSVVGIILSYFLFTRWGLLAAIIPYALFESVIIPSSNIYILISEKFEIKGFLLNSFLLYIPLLGIIIINSFILELIPITTFFFFLKLTICLSFYYAVYFLFIANSDEKMFLKNRIYSLKEMLSYA